MMARLLVPFLAAVVLLASGCSSTREPDPETQYGHRFEETPEDERETLLLAPPDSAEAFFYYPAYYTEVTPRSGPPAPDGRRSVELLFKGALPDACTELHDIRQHRMGHIIDVTFEMRRPKGAMCAQVTRPYRFYYTLDEPLAPGDYTLRVNDAVHPFTVFPADLSEEG